MITCSEGSPCELAGMDFQYRDPERGFDRSSVKGVVAKLVRVKDPANATALEVAAGGKLYQVVVDTEATAKALLSKGQLRNRVTIVPLNKARPSLSPTPVTVVSGGAPPWTAALLRLHHGRKKDMVLHTIGLP